MVQTSRAYLVLRSIVEPEEVAPTSLVSFRRCARTEQVLARCGSARAYLSASGAVYRPSDMLSVALLEVAHVPISPALRDQALVLYVVCFRALLLLLVLQKTLTGGTNPTSKSPDILRCP